MNERYIVGWGNQRTYVAYWGTGDTRQEAEKNLMKAAGKRSLPKTTKVWRFTSELPFVPATDKREATENEADAYMTRDGMQEWIRCEREEIC
jgi:hypothetical protein